MKDDFVLSARARFDKLTKTYWGNCCFDDTHFHPNLFLKFGIILPDSIAQSVVKRQAKFIAGRYAAKLAFKKINDNLALAFYISIGKSFEPIWPDGYIGSISHIKGQAICVIARKKDVDYIGVDIESYLNEARQLKIAPLVHTHAESLVLKKALFSHYQATTLIFSAKESIFKALYQKVKHHFGFGMVRLIDVDIMANTLLFTINIIFAEMYQLPHIISCKFHFMPSYIVTYVVTTS